MIDWFGFIVCAKFTVALTWLTLKMPNLRAFVCVHFAAMPIVAYLIEMELSRFWAWEIGLDPTLEALDPPDVSGASPILVLLVSIVSGAMFWLFRVSRNGSEDRAHANREP